MTYLRIKDDSVLIDLYIQPGARRDSLRGYFDGRLKIQLKARAVDGNANRALIAFVSNALNLPRRSVCLQSGEKSRRKTLRLDGVKAEEVRAWCHLEDGGR